MSKFSLPLTPRAALMLGLLALIALVVLYFPSFASMWHIWGDSNTYTHGYLVFPLVAYLVWLKWDELSQQSFHPRYLPSLLILLLGCVWVASYLFRVEVLGHLSVIGMIIAIVPAVLGTKVFALLLFPLFYLLFAVPMGEGLVPSLMEYTADFTVWALTASGIPVYREGMFFSIPAGDFEVAKACSGIRYLMASFSLGTLFAYLSFTSFKKQVVFSLFSLVLPIVANGLRAYGIVMIAHISDMKYAVGVDHILYGWLFFGFVIFVMFVIGNRFKDEPITLPKSVTPEVMSYTAKRNWLLPILCAGAALLIPRLMLTQALAITQHASNSTIALALGDQDWQGPLKAEFVFQPNFTNYTVLRKAKFVSLNAEVYLWVYRYQPFLEDHEMITETNTLVDLEDRLLLDQKPIAVGGGVADVMESKIRYRSGQILMWHWYQFDQFNAASRTRAKILEGLSWLRGGLQFNESIIVLATDADESEAREVLHEFVSARVDDLIQCLRSDDTDSAQCSSGPQP